MKLPLVCCLLLSATVCLGIEETESQSLAPADVGLKKTIFTARPEHVLIYSLRVSRDRQIVLDEQAAQANASTNTITYFTGRPPWFEGPVFQLPGIGYIAIGYSLTGATGGTEDGGDIVASYQLSHPEKGALTIDLRTKEMPYETARQQFPKLPAPPVAGSPTSMWWKRL
ncbi:MAG: hypothetical protein ABII82_17120 [Verrucomicrobiota bacterium]